MTIYLHPSRDASLSDAYATAFNSASEIFVLSAYLRDWADFQTGKNCKNATIVVGKDFGITRKKALEEVLAWKLKNPIIRHVFVADKIDGFHPKLVIWKQEKGGKIQHYLIVGSSNLSIAGFQSNWEANIRVRITEERYQQIADWIADVLGMSQPLTQRWIDAYQEAPNSGSTNHTRPRVHQGDESGALYLPSFPGLASALAERKERSYAFEDVRDLFEGVVRSCANGNLEPEEFYNWLIKNWNNSAWKFQGNGIFRHPMAKTDWRMLCAALVGCLDSPKETRDDFVRDVYDKLEASQKVRVRKSFLTEMLCHFFPSEYPLWNTPVDKLFENTSQWENRQNGLSVGEEYLYIAKQLRMALRCNPDYPAQNLAELDHVIWAYCKYQGWT